MKVLTKNDSGQVMGFFLNSLTELWIDVALWCMALCSLQWCYNGRDGVSNHQPHDCLLKRLFRRRSKKASKLRITGLFVGNSQVTGEFSAQRASNAEFFSIWWHHHDNGPRYIKSFVSWWQATDGSMDAGPHSNIKSVFLYMMWLFRL